MSRANAAANLPPMVSEAPLADTAEDYAFRFDAPLEPVIFGGELKVTGWLLHREGKPIHGIRAVIRRRWSKRVIVRARRKRERPDVAAAFRDLPGALASGFLLELQLGFGSSELTFEVQDHEKIWRTFATAKISALPLAILTWTGFTNVRRFVIFYLEQWFAGRQAAPNVVESSSLAVTPRLSGSQDGAPLKTKRVELFATSKSNLFIVEIGELVAAGFRELGCEATLHLDDIPEEKAAEGTLQIIVTPHEYYNLFVTPKLPRYMARRLTYDSYLLCTEQPETGWFQSNLQWGTYARAVVDINPLGVAAYRARGLVSHQLQLGYHPMLAHAGTTPNRERKYDITFLGSMTPRRDHFFAQHADFFSQHHCHLRLVPLGFAKTKETRSYLSAERRNELLSDSRILLNVHYSEQKYFEWHRMLVGLANGCCIITETCKGYGELVPGKHFIMVEHEYLVPCCEYYLAHPEECERIATAGREFITTRLRQSQTCGTFLHEIQAQEALTSRDGERDGKPLALSGLALDSAPASLPPRLMETLSRYTRQLLFGALKQDVQGWFGERQQKPEASSIGLATDRPNEEQRAIVITKRKAYKARLDEQNERRGRGESVWQIHENAFARELKTPQLSVLITLYNYAQHIEECIASVTEAAKHLAQAPEIVIVNDASTDDSLARALQCQRASALPIRIVDKKFNTGLADARNTALEIARAPYVFMLDADNLIFPAALQQLLGAISAGDHGAAFSLLCRFRGSPKDRVGLLSYFDFDPQILVQYPYIDAMAMFSRDALRQLGGYDNHLSQIGWFGWEDYDMWLRIAQAGLPVAFVPNTLCLYRHHDTSMINTTNLFESDLVRHFVRKYGDLLDQFEPKDRMFGIDRKHLLKPGQRDAPHAAVRLGGNAG